jgi:predicted dehydrogenase
VTLFPEITARDTGKRHIPEAPSRVTAALEMAGGTSAALTMLSAADHYRPDFEIAGFEGLLICNDPNKFGESLYVKSRDHGDRDLPLEYAIDGQARGAGLVDMALALRDNRPHRLNGDFALHCLEVLLGVLESGRTGTAIEMQTTCERPVPMSKIEPGQPLSAAFALPNGALG